MNPDMPQIIQVDVTNHCNFSCVMCLRQSWNEVLQHFSVDVYQKVAKENFPFIEKLLLYGQGEPLVHPAFLQILEISQKYLVKEAEIAFTTNGSLLHPKIADKILKYPVKEIVFSLDTTDILKLKKIRRGATPQLLENIAYLTKLKGKNGFSRIGIETVLMKSNLHDLLNVIEYAAQLDIDFIVVSHLIPYTENIQDEVLYTTISEESWEISKLILEQGWDIIKKATYEIFETMLGTSNPLTAYYTLNSLWKEAREKNVDINPPLLFEVKDRLPLIQEAQKIFHDAQKMATEYGITVDLPKIVPKIEDRHCPYIERNATVIKVTGDVAPCFNYLYTHPLYINNHFRKEYAISFGNVRNQSLKSIWNSKRYTDFRKKLKTLNRDLPWCGNCPFSTANCFYTETNSYDCYGNAPGCNECLFSVDIAKCLL